MAKTDKFNWENGVTLDEHSRRKLKVLKEYFREYLLTRCKTSRRDKLKLAVVDGFCGAGQYICGAHGSPLIFIETLKEASKEINIERKINKMKEVNIECLFIFNDFNRAAIRLLKERIAPLITESEQRESNTLIEVICHNEAFNEAYPQIKNQIASKGYGNVIFNLDQSGYSLVDLSTIDDILGSWEAAEVFLTFMISALRSFLSNHRTKDTSTKSLPKDLQEMIFSISEQEGGSLINRKEYLGAAERVIFEFFRDKASFVSPFAIHNPEGWYYWFMHFANRVRARQVYNGVLHKNSGQQVHCGTGALRMHSYNPADGGLLYTFDTLSTEKSFPQLVDDVARVVSENGDHMSIEEFYRQAYKQTPAHSDEINRAIIENPDISVITPANNERRSPKTISLDDVIEIKSQKSFSFPRG